MADFSSISFQSNRPLLKEVTADRLNAILQEIRRVRPKGEKGISVRQTGDGTYVGLAANFKSRAPGKLPLQLEIVNNSQVRVYASTIAGGSSTDVGFAQGDDPPYLLAAQAGVVQAGITIDEEGVVNSRWIEIVDQLSEDTDSEFYVEIGTVAGDADGFTASNSRYGPIDANICRDWFSHDPITYSVTFFAGPQ